MSQDPLSQSSYLTEKCEVRVHDVPRGRAVFAVSTIEAGELVGVWSGRIVGASALEGLPDDIRSHTVQVEEGLYLASLSSNEPPDFVNHSCEPNVGLRGQIALVAMRLILPGEQVTMDYAMCDGSPYDEFECSCGSALCRGEVSGDDWRNPDLWTRYAGYFSPYLQRRIDALRRRKTAPEFAKPSVVDYAKTLLES